MSFLNHPRFAIKFAVLVSVFTLLLWCFLPYKVLIHFVEEGQPVESMTLYAYALALIFMVFLPVPQFRLRTRWAVIVVLLTMMAREADLHKAIAKMSILKLRFWTGDSPWSVKLTALAVLLPIIVACLYLLLSRARTVWQDARNNKGHAVTVVTFVCLIALTNILDRSLGIVKGSFGWHAPDWLVALQTSQEEFLELSLPLLALIALLQYRRYAMQSPAMRST